MPKSPKMRAGLTRANSSLDITTSLEAFRPFEEADNETENTRAGNHDSPSVAKAGQTNDEGDNLPEALRPSYDDTPTEGIAQKPSSPGTATSFEPQPDVRSDGASDDGGSFAKTFHGGIRRAYDTSCRELNALFGEIQLEGLSSNTQRAVSQCMLLHLLAISTDDPATYRGSIRRALQICQTMTDRAIGENVWKKTWHIMHEMDEDFSGSSNVPVTQDPRHLRPKPLSTIAEEDDTIDSQEKSSSSSTTSPVAYSDNRNPPRDESTEITEQDPAESAYNNFVAELQADALRRREATDCYIANLEIDILRRTQATDQYLADLEADMGQRRGAAEP
ncbi:hypothetical protein IWZ03DRAFT_44568 [Phyllosticta citriasiana]|uniref:Uncharacterized protein n=1 Tax=Phyllosticta citriasiana TaxID=595635 RepID=A0ABR1KGN3_9PEZI